jgi:hypothetical protein
MKIIFDMRFIFILISDKHRYPYISECMKNYTRVIKEIEALEEDDDKMIVVGYDIPKCDIDGSFAAVQCMNSQYDY